ncbi:MAG TPA: site-2 protease family protein [Candidatus Baltobacteraceae bacterium]|nr:site-2 protease family protein [Candidatus Baltobacteraceae bacterium]
MADYSPYIGSIDGIKIQLHWSFVLLLAIVLVLSIQAPFLAVIWVLLFACVLVHELTHSITSKRNKIAVKKIVLYPFGGGSIIDFENVTPEVEFRISIVGPIASLVLAGVFGLAAIFTPGGFIHYTLQILFILNLLLGVFNILPWFPLDGGRALRSYLQERTSPFRATTNAVRISNIITGIFIAGTIFYAVLIHGYTLAYREFIILWDVIIALFIYTSAKQELRAAYIRENIKGLKVSDVISRTYTMASRDTTIAKLYKMVLKANAHIIIYREGSAMKALSEASIDQIYKRGRPSHVIGKFGVEIPKVEYGMDLYKAIERMRNYNVGVAAVLRGGKIVGVLLAPHIESVIALHISGRKARQTNKNRS